MGTEGEAGQTSRLQGPRSRLSVASVVSSLLDGSGSSPDGQTSFAFSLPISYSGFSSLEHVNTVLQEFHPVTYHMLEAKCWRIPGTGEPGGLLSMGSHRVGHD